MGIGTVVIGGGLILSAILNMPIKSNITALIGGAITLVTVIAGIALMLYAQIKYNICRNLQMNQLIGCPEEYEFGFKC